MVIVGLCLKVLLFLLALAYLLGLLVCATTFLPSLPGRMHVYLPYESLRNWFIDTIISIPLAIPFNFKTPYVIGNEQLEDNNPPWIRAAIRRGERTPSPANLLPEFEKVGITTINVDANANSNRNQNQSKVPRTKRLLSSVFRPLKLSDNLDPLPKKYHEWLPKFKGAADQNANDHIYDFFWAIGSKGIDDEDLIMMSFDLSLEEHVRE